MNKISVFAVLVLLAASGFAAVPRIVENSLAFSQDGGVATIAYQLTGADAIVTVDILTNGVSVGKDVLAELTGDVRHKVAPGARAIEWRPWVGLLRDVKIPRGSVSVKLTAHPTYAPPAIMVVDCKGSGTEAITYYESLEQLPDGGLANDKYRRQCLVLKKITPRNRDWRMGSKVQGTPGGEVGHWPGKVGEDVCHVTLSGDYYIGIYELTRAQIECLDGGAGTAGDGMRPYCETGSNYNWMMGKLAAWNAKFGEAGLTLPTSAQWEYACRAGTESAFCNGRSLAHNNSNEADDVCWCNRDSGGASHDVGTKNANSFGLHDMHGNVWEHCLDKVDPVLGLPSHLNKKLLDPTGYAGNDATNSVIRGGSYWYEAQYCRSAHIAAYPISSTGANDHYGFRLAVDIR
jgi:hypothetical protein